MKKKRNTKSHLKPIDFIVGIICVAGMASALFLFQKDLNYSSTKQNEEPVAVIYFKYKTAQRNFANKNLWELLKTSSKIYNGDRIRTAALSEAYLLFNDGSKIDLHENSLIRIQSDNSHNTLDFIEGAVSVTSSNNENKISIKTGDKYLNFNGNSSAEIRMSERGSNKATVAVTSGTVDVSKSAPKKITNAVRIINNPQVEEKNENDEGKIETLEIGDIISYSAKSSSPAKNNSNKEEKSTTNGVASDKVASTEIASDEMTVFIPSTTYSIKVENNKANVPFYWNSTKNTRLEFSNTADFSIITSANKLPAGNNKASVPVKFINANSLNMYWRIVPLDKTISKVYQSGMIIGRQEDNAELAKVAKETFGEKKSVSIINRANDADEVLQKNQIELPVAQEEKIVPVEKQIEEQKKKEEDVKKQLSITNKEIEQSAKKEEVERFEKIKAKEAAERKQKEKIAADKKAKAEKIAKANAEAARKAAAEKAAKQKAEEQRLATQKAAAQKKAAEIKAKEEKAAQEKAAAEKKAQEEKLAQEKAAAEKKAQEEKLANDKAIAEKKAQEEKLAQEKAAAEKKAQEEKLAQEKAAAEQKAQEEKLEQEKIAAEQKANEEKLAQEKAEQEKIAKEKSKVLPAAELVAPLNSTEFTENNFNEENPKISFSWNNVENASWYRFTLYQGTEKDSKIVQYKVKSTSIEIKGKRLAQIKNGTVTWKVEAVYEKDNETVYGKPSLRTFNMNVADVENVQLDTSDLLLDE
ncbi:MAG: FecR domain-containing protein [Treponema sp.]